MFHVERNEGNMLINKIQLLGFRNYPEANITFNKGINAIYGENGSGKTNILEAICWVSTTKSFKTSDDNYMVNERMNDMKVIIKASRDNMSKEFEADYSRMQHRKNFRINGNRLKKHSDIVGELPIVMFSPENIMMVKGEPKLRRNFIDAMLSMISKDYYSLLTRYNKSVSHRNYILKKIKENAASVQNLDIWDEQIADAGSKIVIYRLSKINDLNKIIDEKFNIKSKMIRVEYSSTISLTENDQLMKTEILAKLKNSRSEELSRAITLTGPHRDDLEILFNEKPAKIFASEGQQRLSAIILKLAEGVLAFQEHLTFPVILLDDFSSELDEPNRQFIKDRFSLFEQIIITTTYKSNIKDFNPGKEFHVEQGTISKLS